MSDALVRLNNAIDALREEYEQSVLDCRQRMLEIQQERDQLRAELAAAKEEIQTWRLRHRDAMDTATRKVQQAEEVAAERDALAADNERLRAALELAKSLRTAAWTGTAHVAAMVGHDIDDCECETCKGSRAELNHISDVMRNALAATHSQPLAAHDAALLREVAGGVDKIAVVPTIDTPQSMRDLIADAIRAKADRIEKEAANG